MEGSTDILPRIVALHQSVESYRDQCVALAREAVKAVIEAGELLLAEKKTRKGEFLLWFEVSLSPMFSLRTAENYMNCAKKYSQALANSEIDFQSVKELYIASGIMPPPSSSTHQDTDSDPFIGFWAMTKKIDGWLPRIEERDAPRLRDWWVKIGSRFNWL